MRKNDEKENGKEEWQRRMRKSAYKAKVSYNLVMATDDDLAAAQLPEVEHRSNPQCPG